MQKFLLFAIKLSILFLPVSLDGQMVISAVFDGDLPGGQPKGIELYAFEAIPDLSIFAVGGANNGGGSDGIEFEFPAVAVSAGTYIYLADDAIQFNAFFGFSPDYEDTVNPTAMAINGNDAVELFKDGILFDLFGVLTYPEVDCPTPWGYRDGWAARNMDVGPTTTFDPSDWTFSGCNALDGETSNGAAATPVPLGQFTLPVTLTSFRARINDEEVLISWATSEEVDNDYFVIERSGDGRDFDELAMIPGLNSRSGGNYLHIDKQPLSGVSYYRLRQVDIDGTTNYFGPRSVQMDKEDNLQPDVFPNPASNWLTISPISDQLQTIRLIDRQGRVVKQWEQEAFIATNRFDLGGLAPGIYMLQAIAADRTAWSKRIAIGQ